MGNEQNGITLKDNTPKFLNGVTEHPDVQRLIKQVVRSDAKNKQLKKALKTYGQHLIGCESSMYSPQRSGVKPKCSCGLRQLLE